jgi:NTE family protein
MTSADRARASSPLDAALDIFRMRQYFDVIVRARDVASAATRDLRFVDTVRRGLLPLPFDRRPSPSRVFEQSSGSTPAGLDGRVAVVTTGGSGALASLVGVARALEETGTPVSVYSVCSGAALFGFPLGAGMSPEEVAELTASMVPREYVDLGWRELALLVPTLGRGWAGLLRGDRLESFFRSHLGDLTLGQLAVPTYAPIWNVEHNRLDYLGPRTHPDLPVARAIRMAVSLPLFVQPVTLDGLAWCDGGIVDIFPVHPVLDLEPPPDCAIAVNGFYPHDFEGEDATGWERRPLSIVTAAAQVRTSQQVQLARENIARLRAATHTVLVEPVPYQKVAGTGFYEQFIDTAEWPEFMRAGRSVMLDALEAEEARGRPHGTG